MTLHWSPRRGGNVRLRPCSAPPRRAGRVRTKGTLVQGLELDISRSDDAGPDWPTVVEDAVLRQDMEWLTAAEAAAQRRDEEGARAAADEQPRTQQTRHDDHPLPFDALLDRR